MINYIIGFVLLIAAFRFSHWFSFERIYQHRLTAMRKQYADTTEESLWL